MTNPIAPHLFVYGTLMTAAPTRMGRAQRERLQRESQTLGPATIAGRLADLGSYPGLVAPAGDDDVVHGEVVLLTNPQYSFHWLDVYEGLIPGHHDHNEYERARREALLADGRPVMAWVYVWCRPFTAAQLIVGGNWLAHIQGRI